jgi:signal transduction histidine kinase/DNA-binding response OmpR family regulator
MEINIRTKTGRVTEGLLSSAAVELDGKSCAVTMVRDIGDRKEMERNLVAARESAMAASKAKSEFLSSMSHEIRTPMTAVLGMADLLTETELSGEQRRYLDIMVANGNSLLELINSILDLARIESGRLQLEKTEFDLTELIDKTISTFGVRAHGKGLELIARIAPGVPERLVGDPLRLRQVLINLLGNAIKFTELGQIVLEVEQDPESKESGAFRFTVADTGIGIAADKLDSIFGSFNQADSSTTRLYGGSGLGLAIAHRLVGLMDGRIWVDSELNKGSKFCFTARFGLETRVVSAAAHVVLSLADYRVLVVDDNQINRLIVREMVTSCGAEVSEAASGEEALAAIREGVSADRPYRIVLLDMRMPGMDGLEVARRIREEHLPIRPLILMLSSDDLKPQVARLRELGLDAYLVKPITRKELFEAIRRVIEEANLNSADTLPERRRAPQIQSAASPDGPEMRILVAEDSPDNRLVIAAYLRREPYQVDFAVDGREAVNKFIAQHYDLVFMDIQMPEVDGLAATRTIRRWENDHGLSPTPIIALTASVLEEDVKLALASGCSLHMSKPVKKRVLLDAVRNAALLRAADAPGSVPVTDAISAVPQPNGPVSG